MGNMLIKKAVGARIDGEHLQFDQELGIQWILDIHSAWMKLQPLCHILQGLPGRMMEESLYNPVNTDQASANVVSKGDYGTGGFSSRYHKGVNMTGRYKHILCLLPHKVFLILYVLVHVIQLIELSVLFQYVVPAEGQQSTADAYKTRVYASLGNAWSPEQMSANLI